MNRPSSPPADIIPPDNGCAYSPSCLKCRLPYCRYDTNGKAERDAAIRQLSRQGMPFEHIANLYGIKPRTVRLIAGTA